MLFQRVPVCPALHGGLQRLCVVIAGFRLQKGVRVSQCRCRRALDEFPDALFFAQRRGGILFHRPDGKGKNDLFLANHAAIFDQKRKKLVRFLRGFIAHAQRFVCAVKSPPEGKVRRVVAEINFALATVLDFLGCAIAMFYASP